MIEDLGKQFETPKISIEALDSQTFEAAMQRVLAVKDKSSHRRE